MVVIERIFANTVQDLLCISIFRGGGLLLEF